MEKFPSELELIAASALLLLPIAVFSDKQNSARSGSSDDPIELASICDRSGVKRDKSIRSDSKSNDISWLTRSDASSSAVQARRMKLMSAFTANLKNLRRRRSKIHRRFHGRQAASLNSRKATASASLQSVSDTSSEVSCLSSNRSDHSSAQSIKKAKTPAPAEEELKRRGAISLNIRRRAGDILNLLSGGCSSEVRIRQLLGDSPDTSKALRILLKRAEVKRTGAGGRSDPYIYTISAEAQDPELTSRINFTN